MKRLLDILLVVASAPAWAPLMLAVAAAVRWRMGAPVLFRQERAGKGGRPFTMVKFRMLVLRGTMSLVGPRPLPTRYLPRYTARQMRRHEALPGITGWAQVNGRNLLSWDEKFRLDVWYVDHRSLLLDVKILLMTVLAVFRASGISAAGEATMGEFTGSEEIFHSGP